MHTISTTKQSQNQKSDNLVQDDSNTEAMTILLVTFQDSLDPWEQLVDIGVGLALDENLHYGGTSNLEICL